MTTGDITGNIVLGPKQWARINAAGNAFEAAVMASDYSELTGTPSLAAVATSGSYNDLSDKPAGSSPRTFATPPFAGTGGATVATQLSATRDAGVSYSFDASVTISLLAGQSVTATLSYADNSGMSTNVVVVDAATTSNSGVLNLTQTNTLKVSGYVPAGKYRRVTLASTGTGTVLPTTIKAGQETLL